MNKMWNTEYFIKKSKCVHGDKYDYSLSVYKSSSEKIKIICPDHGIFEQLSTSHIIKKQRCPECVGVKKMNKIDFIEKACIIHGDKYDYSLIDYKNNKTKIKIICPFHGIFITRPDNHLNRRSGCPICANNILYDKEKFIKKAKEIHNDKYDYSLVKYETAHIKIKIICPEHGIFFQKPNSHLNGSGCNKCSKNHTVSIEEFINISNNKHNNKYDYSLVTEIKNHLDKVKIICPIHGVFEKRIKYHMKGIGCRRCNESRGEKIISEILERKGILFEKEKRFDDCRNKLPLPFDFYLPEHNICIEYDGEHHFHIYEAFGGQKSLESQIYRDSIKTSYCEDNNIKLIRIRYDESIDEKLSDFLKNEI